MIALLESRAALAGVDSAWLLERDVASLSPPGLSSANGSCRLLQTRDGWLAINLARPDDRDVIPALTLGALDTGADWDALADHALRCRTRDFFNRAVELQLPVALPGEAEPMLLPEETSRQVPRRVVDLSALWAGPLCAGLLARAGAEVLRIDSVARPDPTPLSAPQLDARINAGKSRVSLDLRSTPDLARLHDIVARADVLVTSARAPALQRLGITQARFPGLTWVAITGHGLSTNRVGFGDDCAVAGGLVQRTANGPRFLGDALADPLTGLEAALAVLSGATGLIDMAMSRVAASYALSL